MKFSPPVAVLMPLLSLAIGSGVASANDIYIAQTAAGSNNGQGCANAYAYTFFNSSANWGTGANQIGPGTTVHLCGTFTVPGGATGLTAQRDGAAGNPVTVVFETGAVLQSAYFAGGGNGGAVNIAGRSYIVIDGGIACGATQGGVDSSNTCNGTIQNTANGSSPTYANQQYSIAIVASGSTGCEIRNLLVRNMYVRTSLSDVSVTNDVASAVVALPATGLRIHDSTFHDASWVFKLAGTNLQFYNNNLYNFDHGIAVGQGGSNTTAFLIHDNHFHDMAAWDDSTGNNSYHHDGIHIWIGSTETDQAYVYNNTFDGDPGQNTGGRTGPNGWIYDEGGLTNSYIFNNTFLTSNPNTTFPSEVGEFSSSNFVINNTVTGGAGSAGNSLGVANSNQSVFNNIVGGSQYTMALNAGTTLAVYNLAAGTGIDSNVYVTSGGTVFGYPTSGTNSLSAWQSALPAGSGQDLHATVGTAAQINLTSDGRIGPNSTAAARGQNLSPLCAANPYLGPLCRDKAGNPRPSTGAWDPGAYNASNSSSPSPPSGLTGSAH